MRRLRRAVLVIALLAGCGPVDSCAEMYRRSVEEGRRCTGSGCDEPCASGCDSEKNASGSPSGL